jgi:hypothetical protein
MGVAFCLLFTWWFVSGIFMMYWDYPTVGTDDRLQHAQALTPELVRFSAAEAYAKLENYGPPEGVRLNVFAGRPVYRFQIGGDEVLVHADDGTPLTEFPSEMNLRVAAEWSGQLPSLAKIEVVNRPDQWTVSGEFRPLRPLRKFTWPDGQEVYVSQVTGEVVQYTTRGSRLGAYLGAVPHWLYFTPLRVNGRLWSRVVIWASGMATVAAFLGLIVGIWMYAPKRRVPYRGQKRLHMVLGLFFGILACTWAFSGMLSMDPFPTRSRGGPGGRIQAALRGDFRFNAFVAKHPREAIVAAGIPVKELEFSSFAGDPVYVAHGEPPQVQIVPVSGPPNSQFDQNRIIDVVEKVMPIRESRRLERYDAYYLDRHHHLPLPVILVRLDDAANARYYIDPRTARIVGGYRDDSWITRWLYHGLHSLNFPWLYNYRPAWDIVVLSLMVGGVSLSVTSVVIAGQLLRRELLPRAK